ncbi:SDR family NAD(P)-dependent oxidoreductase, partial [Streptomyces zagrosensis]
PTYWAQHIRQPVHFHPAITHTIPTTHTYLELGPDPTLTTATQHTLHHHHTTTPPTTEGASPPPTPLMVATLTRKQPEVHAFGLALGQLYAAGAQVDWAGWFPVTPPPRVVELPTYAFQRQRYWVEPPAARPGGAGGGQDAGDARLWDAIEGLDVDALTSTLKLEPDSPSMAALLPALPVLSTWRRAHREQSVIDSWRYGTSWTRLPEPAPPVLAGSWLLVLPAGYEDHPAVQAVSEALDAHGALRTDVVVDSATVERHLVTQQLHQATDAAVPLDGVVSLLALADGSHAEYAAVPVGLAATTVLVQALGDADIAAPLWCLTQGAVAAESGDVLPCPHQAEIWGLGRVAALEHPDRWGGLIDLPTEIDEQTPGRLAALLTPGQPEDQVAIRAGLLARRLHHAPSTPTTTPWKPSGTTLITGGTGALGTHIARWLATHGATQLLLTSRTGPNAPGATQLTEELTALGTTVTITACDVSDREQLRALIDTIPAEQPLTTVIHAAGLPENTPFTELDLPHIDSVLRPKALAAAHLHELTKDLDLSAFVLFSSGAAAWGGSHQGAYAAANTYLDALAEHRHALGLPATSLAWAPWGETGMAADDVASTYYSRRGMNPLSPELAVKSLHHALSQGDTTLTIADIDWHTFPTSFTTQRPSPLLTDLTPNTTPHEPHTTTATTNALQQQLADSTPGQQQQIVLHHIQTTAAHILGHPTIDAVPATQPFQDLGFDSLTAVELRNQLASATGLDLTPALIFDHPTPKELADFLREQLVDVDVASEGQLLSELDRWDTTSDSAAVDEAARRRITGRLQLLLAKWSDTGADTEPSTAHSDLHTATAEDIFDLISDEFGKS